MTAAPATASAADHPVCIRPLRRDDGDLLDRIMAGMSAQSRYQRFHGPKPELTAADRAYFTSVDGRDHLALVAFGADGAPVGVARAVRLRDDAGAAEVAVAIVDPSQRQGVGRELMRRLARCAAAAGIERLVANVLADTGLGPALARRGWRLTGRDGPTLTFDVSGWRLAAAG